MDRLSSGHVEVSLFVASPVKGESSGKAIKPAERLSSDPSTPDTGAGNISPGGGVSFGSAEAIMPRASGTRSTISYMKSVLRGYCAGVCALQNQTRRDR